MQSIGIPGDPGLCRAHNSLNGNMASEILVNSLQLGSAEPSMTKMVNQGVSRGGGGGLDIIRQECTGNRE